MLADLLPLLALGPVLYGSAFLHEVGHALCGRLAGFEVTSFGLGTGRPFWVARCGSARVYLCRQRPLQGITFTVFPLLFPSRGRAVCMLSGGILAHAFLTAAALALWQWLPWAPALWLAAAALNGLMALSNLVPFSFRVGGTWMRSDGALILWTLRHGLPTTPAHLLLSMLHQFRSLWQGTGDLRALQVYLLLAGLAWIDLGDGECAVQLIEEAAALPIDPGPALAAYLEAGRGLAEAEAGRPGPANAALDRAEDGFRRLGHAAGLFVVQWRRADLRLRQGDAPAAVRDLDDLASHPLARYTCMRRALLAARVAAHAALPGDEDVEAALALYEGIPAGAPDWTEDLRVYRALARGALARGDEEQAVAAYRRALGAVRRLDEALSGPTDRERFRRCQTPLVAEAQDCLRRTGRLRAAEKLNRFFPPEAPPGQEEEARRRRDRRALGWGLGLTLANLLWGLYALVMTCLLAGAAAPPRPGIDLGLGWTLSWVLCLGGVLLAAAYGAVAGPVAWRRPSWRGPLGRWLLWIALLPWVVWAAVVLLVEVAVWHQPGAGP